MTQSLLSDPTELESTVAQLAADLKVAGLGQRARAALRRNQGANDDTFLPHAMFKDVPGPDLVRHANATFIAALMKPHGELRFGSADDQLLAVLQRQLEEVRRFVARLWDGPLSHVAAAFVDYDNLPVPFCPMYPNARELLASDLTLPHQLERILGRLRAPLYRTEALAAASEQSAAAAPGLITRLTETKEALLPDLPAQPPESLRGWNQRISRRVAAARDDVPRALLAANSLINATVGSLVSLAVWDHSLSHSDLLSSTRWPDYADEDCRSESGDDPDAQDDAAGFALPPLHRGHRLQIKFNPALFAPMDSAVQLQCGKLRKGVAILKGLSMSWSQGGDVDCSLDVVRLADYERFDAAVTKTAPSPESPTAFDPPIIRVFLGESPQSLIEQYDGWSAVKSDLASLTTPIDIVEQIEIALECLIRVEQAYIEALRPELCSAAEVLQQVLGDPDSYEGAPHLIRYPEGVEASTLKLNINEIDADRVRAAMQLAAQGPSNA